MRALARPILRRVRAVLGVTHGPIISPASHIIGLADATINPSARLFVRADGRGRQGIIRLGKGVYVGREVELATALGGDMVIGEDTSIQDRCVFHGDVEIGAHCLFGANGMLSTTIHRFRDQPAWLIRDQDAAIADVADKPADYSLPIRIEDDCWIGWGATVMPGVYVGRGAIIGANSVVSRDIGPYEIHGGVPNRLLSKRLDFSPGTSVSSANADDLPYFYRGFRLRQKDLRKAQKAGIRANGSQAALVLAGGSGKVRVEGLALRPTVLEFRINGRPAGRRQTGAEPFHLELEPEGAQKSPLPGPLAEFTVIEIIESGHAGPDGGADRYAITFAGLC